MQRLEYRQSFCTRTIYNIADLLRTSAVRRKSPVYMNEGETEISLQHPVCCYCSAAELLQQRQQQLGPLCAAMAPPAIFPRRVEMGASRRVHVYSCK